MNNLFLFLDENYKYDCENPINLLTVSSSQTDSMTNVEKLNEVRFRDLIANDKIIAVTEGNKTVYYKKGTTQKFAEIENSTSS